MKQLQKKIKSGTLDLKKDDPFELFISATNIRYCYYAETHKILGNTYGMCVLQVRTSQDCLTVLFDTNCCKLIWTKLSQPAKVSVLVSLVQIHVTWSITTVFPPYGTCTMYMYVLIHIRILISPHFASLFFYI